MLAAPSDLPSDPKAAALMEEATDAYRNEDYERAAKLLEQAYVIEPKPVLLYPWAQAEREAGRCESAIRLYEEVIVAEPRETLVEYSKQNIARCVAEMQTRDEGERSADDSGSNASSVGDPSSEALANNVGAEENPSTAVVDSGERSSGRRWYADPVGGALAGAGVVGTVVGGALLGVGRSTAADADQAATHGDYQDDVDRATRLRNGGAATLAIGGALLVAGAIRYTILAVKKGPTQERHARRWRPGVVVRF